jgi:hypothetical protein
VLASPPDEPAVADYVVGQNSGRAALSAFFGYMEQPPRSIATRYDRLAANYLAFIKLASIRLWLRTYESTH